MSRTIERKLEKFKDTSFEKTSYDIDLVAHELVTAICNGDAKTLNKLVKQGEVFQQQQVIKMVHQILSEQRKYDEENDEEVHCLQDKSAKFTDLVLRLLTLNFQTEPTMHFLENLIFFEQLIFVGERLFHFNNHLSLGVDFFFSR